MLDFYLWVKDPNMISKITIMFDCNGTSPTRFAYDYYSYSWTSDGKPYAVTQPRNKYMGPAYRTDPSFEDPYETYDNTPTTVMRLDKGAVGHSGWNHMTIARGNLNRTGLTPGKNWSTICAVKIVAEGIDGGDAPVIALDNVRLVGGDNRPLTGKYRWRYIFVRNCGDYFSQSYPSPESTELELMGQACQIGIPQAALDAMDLQVDQIWVYRIGGYLQQYYRTQIILIPNLTKANNGYDYTQEWEFVDGWVTSPLGMANHTVSWEMAFGGTGNPGVYTYDWELADGYVTGITSVSVDDTMSDRDAMITDMVMEYDALRPPQQIIGIAGPYYDRMFCLTDTHLYPSEIGNPESFKDGQVIRVSGEGEDALWIQQTMIGLLIGTTKDIYRLEGTGEEYPDGTVDWRKRPLNIAAPPISEAVAADGNDIIYLALDGWRLLQGQISTSIRGDTDLMWRGYTRHEMNVILINVYPPIRMKAAFANGLFTAMTPEGSNSIFSPYLWRYNFLQSRWYRFIYPTNWTTVYRETDGTILAGTNDGYVWILDVGDNGIPVNQDDGNDIPIEIWTIRDDNDTPMNRKDLQSIGLRMDTYLNFLTVQLWQDSNPQKSWEFDTRMWGGGTIHRPIPNLDLDLDPCTHVQLRMTGSFSTFKLHEWWVQYIEYPTQMLGQVPYSCINKYDEGVVSGYKMMLNTMGKEVVFTSLVDHEVYDTYTIKTEIKHPTDIVHKFHEPVRATDIAFSTDCPIELYSWEFSLMYPLPSRRRVWDTGELDLWRRYGRLRKIRIKAECQQDLDIVAYFDDLEKPALKCPVENDRAAIYEIKCGREYHGTMNRIVVTSDGQFLPYWMDLIYSPTGDVTERLQKVRVAPDKGVWDSK
jgi:hypothetical protein